MSKGRLIAIEGIDGSGKGTQAELLRMNFKNHGYPVAVVSFPRYHTPTGKLIAKYLNGQLKFDGAKLIAFLYALNRYEYRDQLIKSLNQGNVVILDRYTGSNMIHLVY
ncbi:MAG: hypothetical protein HYW51_02330 [Candidatus Doudnabacteria bacterium]|nr:hypothetical protein [Candidatus Doudnabacteria bacterium]